MPRSEHTALVCLSCELPIYAADAAKLNVLRCGCGGTRRIAERTHRDDNVRASLHFSILQSLALLCLLPAGAPVTKLPQPALAFFLAAPESVSKRS